MMAMLVTLIFVLLKAGLGRGLSLSLTILRSVQIFFYLYYAPTLLWILVFVNLLKEFLLKLIAMVVYLAGLLGWLIFPRVCQLLISKQREQFRHTLSGSRVQKAFPQNSIVSPPFASVLRMLDTKPQSNQCFFIPTARWSCFLQKRSIFGNTKIFISLPFNWELLFSAVERVRSVWSVQRFLPVPASLPSPHPLHTHIPHCIQDISENNFLNCWRFSAFPIQDVYGRRNVFPNTSLSSKMSDEKI